MPAKPAAARAVVGARIRAERERRGIRQRDWARRLGVTLATYQQYERSDLRESTLTRIVTTLGLDPAAIVPDLVKTRPP